MTTCPLCRRKKARRACPAKGATICSHCCGTKRQVEIDCPPDCVYLRGEHAAGWAGRETERRRDYRRLAAELEALSEAQAELFFVGLIAVGQFRRSSTHLTDGLLAKALEAFRQTVTTRSRGILYDHQAQDVRAQGLLGALREVFERGDGSEAWTPPPDDDLLPALRALEASVRETIKQAEGPTAFVDTAVRLTKDGAVEDRPRPGRLILEP